MSIHLRLEKQYIDRENNVVELDILVRELKTLRLRLEARIILRIESDGSYRVSIRCIMNQRAIRTRYIAWEVFTI